jgi:BirA family biotin operon repressor/biotin-[acetyl-CoA-carboxylase] ligase
VILDAWRQWPNMLGKRVRVTSGRDQVEGTAVEIDSQGALIVRMKEGKMERVVAGDVHMAEV